MEKTTELVQEWIRKAEHDLGMANLAMTYQPEFRDSICFHCQQAAEKYLKAFLIKNHIEFKKTHSLTYLLDLISDEINLPNEVYDYAEILEDYGVAVRYPESREPSEEDTREALESVNIIKNFIAPFYIIL